MKKLSIALAVGLVLILLLATTALADVSDFSVVSYEDTAADGFDPGTVGGDQYIVNGDFSLWSGGKPEGWEVWADTKAGWEQAHLAQADLAYPGSPGVNDAMAFFVRNVGGAGPYYVGTYQMLDSIPAEGYYWVNIHGTMFGEYFFFDAFNLRFTEAAYNSVAWYGIGDTADPASVTEWRELPFTPWSDGVLPCHNEDETCAYIGRYETLYLMPGQYFHIKAGHKFSHFNYWTTFVFDDISIVPAAGTVVDDGLLYDGDLEWDRTELR